MMPKSLRILRTERGLTQKALAQKAHVHPVDLSRYEGGRVTPSGPALQRLAAALGCDANDIDLEASRRQAVA